MSRAITDRPREESRLHTRMLKFALELENSRIFWAVSGGKTGLTAEQAFEAGHFGQRSFARVRELLTNLRARYEAFPVALTVLNRWEEMGIETQRLICHWHLQLSDPLYRRFSGSFLPDRLQQGQLTVTQQQVITWLAKAGAGRWSGSTRIKFASKLLSSAYTAGLLGSKRDPRPIVLPRVPDEALAYLMHLLREVEIEGTLLANPYLRSIGLEGSLLSDRLRRLPELAFGSQGGLVEMGWRHSDLADWSAKAGVSGFKNAKLVMA